MRIGFIGLGIMGKPMCRNLLKAGFDLTVQSRTKESVDQLAAAGAKVAKTPAELAAQVDLLITMVPNSPEVRAVLLGENGAVHGAKAGLLVVDMSSIAPLASQKIAEELAAHGVRFVDAPVSGGEPKAVEGTLSVMAGGAEADFEAAKPVLSAMAASVVRVGGVGAGNVAKLCNQIVVAVNIAAVSEALMLAQKSGVDPEVVYKAIRGGLAGSTVMDAKAPMMLARNITPGFKVKLHVKDLVNVLSTGHEVGAPLPLTAQVMEMMQALVASGLGEADHGSLVRFYEKIAEAEVGG